MFRKILSLLLLLLAGFSGSAQKIETDHTCFDIEIDLDYERERDEDCLPIKDQYVVCRDQTIFIPPIVDAELRRTDTYGVSGISYNPYPLTGTDILDRKSTRLNSSHVRISYAVFCLKKKTTK